MRKCWILWCLPPPPPLALPLPLTLPPPRCVFPRAPPPLTPSPEIATRRVFLPEVLRDDDRALVFFRQDDIFGKPKATCQFVLVAPPAYESPAAAVMSDLFAKLVKVGAWA